MHRALGVGLPVLLFFVTLMGWTGVPAQAAGPLTPPALSAEAAVLIDGTTGQILYEKNAEKPLYPASITKIMTAYLAIVSPAWSRTLTVSEEAALQPGSSNYLLAGQRLPVAAVAQAMMLTSGNDSAWALAQAVSGSERAFVQLMNRTAAAWGAPGIHFDNPTGLPDPRHVVTALGMAVIAQHAMQNPIFRHLVDTRQASLPPDPAPRIFYSQNQLLYSFPGANGIKLGYTIEAGETLVASASRHGTFLIAVLLHDSPYALWGDGAALLDWGFSHFHPVTVIARGRIFTVVRRHGARIPLTVADSVTLLAADGSRRAYGSVRQHVLVTAPPSGRRGMVVGLLTVSDGQERPLVERTLLAARAWVDPPAVPPVRWTPQWPLLAGLTVLGYLWWMKEKRHAA